MRKKLLLICKKLFVITHNSAIKIYIKFSPKSTNNDAKEFLN